jgi:septum formation protein
MESRIILASASPRRKALLGHILDDFTIIPSQTEESLDGTDPPVEIVMRNALEKALDVSRGHPDSVVIGADTIVVLDGKILGKPQDSGDAASMLQSLSGKTHLVITGLALVCTKPPIQTTGYETARVTFKKLSRNTIENYVASGKCLDKAGAYGIQDIGDDFVREVDGDYYNVMGLPLELLKRMLREAGIIP